MGFAKNYVDFHLIFYKLKAFQILFEANFCLLMWLLPSTCDFQISPFLWKDDSLNKLKLQKKCLIHYMVKIAKRSIAFCEAFAKTVFLWAESDHCHKNCNVSVFSKLRDRKFFAPERPSMLSTEERMLSKAKPNELGWMSNS